jgi:diketogulonate reductase-like aldo/keto reductase
VLESTFSRRRFLATLSAAAAEAWPEFVTAQASAPISAQGDVPVIAQGSAAITRPIPSTGERLPAVGLGTWLTFNVKPEPAAEAPLAPVLQTFFERGGAMVDSSPMYGLSEDVIGDLLKRTGRERLFSATKIWTIGKALGRWQLERSRKLWGVPKFDLVHIHNMLDWRTHLETLKEMKAAGAVRYIGITTSHGARHDEMELALTRERFDFVQLTYNLSDRRVEERLLPLAAERRIAVVINRPFYGGSLFSVPGKRPVPEWAREFDCENWAQFFLKFVVSHPSVTCAIPATSKVEHLRQNIGALYRGLPDAALRTRMAKYIESL